MTSLADAPFYIKSGKQEHYGSDLRTLWERYGLLRTKADEKQLRAYLATPYLVPNNAIGALHEALFRRYRDRDSKAYCLAVNLIAELKPTNPEITKLRQLGKLIRQLSEEVLRFRMMETFLSSEALQHQVMVEALQNEGLTGTYQLLLGRWQEAIEKLKLGRVRSLFTWLLYDARHYNQDITKVKLKHVHVAEAHEALDLLYKLSSTMYAAEKANIKSILGHVDLPSLGKDHDPTRRLTMLHEDMQRLLRPDGGDRQRYERSKATYEDLYDRLTQDDRRILFTDFINYLTRENRLGDDRAAMDLMGWIAFMFEHDHHHDAKIITRQFYLNRLQDAIRARHLDTAARIYEELSPCLAPAERESADLVGGIMLQFARDEHEGVLNTIKKMVPKIKLNAHTDGLRIKFMGLKSSLCLTLAGKVDVTDFYKKGADNIKLLIANNPKHFSSIRKSALLRFFDVADQLLSAHERGELAGAMPSIKGQILADLPLESRAWLCCLAAHFDAAGKLPPGRAILPTKHQGEPWAQPTG